jgi:cell division septum initiation protein DivIVA
MKKLLIALALTVSPAMASPPVSINPDSYGMPQTHIQRLFDDIDGLIQINKQLHDENCQLYDQVQQLQNRVDALEKAFFESQKNQPSATTSKASKVRGITHALQRFGQGFCDGYVRSACTQFPMFVIPPQFPQPAPIPMPQMQNLLPQQIYVHQY